jgi:aminoglycoside phosphotransferase (APT) family kinase protein
VVDEAQVLAALGLPAGTAAHSEALGDSPWSPVLVTVRGESQLQAVVREPADPQAAQNHAAVAEALARAGFSFAPRLLGFAGTATVEEALAGTTAMQLVPPPGAAEAAMEALAALHELPVREGLDWGAEPADLFPESEWPLHRLGFSSAERDPAREPLSAAHVELLRSPFGFAHRDAVAANVVLAPGKAWLIDFSAAGYGPQYFDVAAFLLTAGIEPAGRRALAATYARRRGTPPDTTADAIDLLGILWALRWQLDLPRRLITSLGDDSGTEALKLAASRIDRAIRQPSGDSPIAAAIRAALWPARAGG